MAINKINRLLTLASKASRARYERLGCFTGVLFLGGLFLGLFVSVRLCEATTITLMHPFGGYIVDGLRYADPHGKWLTNGESVPGPLRLLTPPLYLTLMFAWMAGSLFVLTAVDRLVSYCMVMMSKNSILKRILSKSQK